MKQVVLRGTNREEMYVKLAELGLEVRDAVDADGNPVRDEDRIERCAGPWLTDIRGHHIVSVLLSESQAVKLPEVLDPVTFIKDWDSDAQQVTGQDEEGNDVLGTYDRPVYTVGREVDGEIVEVQQGAGQIGGKV